MHAHRHTSFTDSFLAEVGIARNVIAVILSSFVGLCMANIRSTSTAKQRCGILLLCCSNNEDKGNAINNANQLYAFQR